MPFDITATLQQHRTYDGLILVHPHIQVLEKVPNQIKELDYAILNVGKELSASLLTVSLPERSRFLQQWLIDTLSLFQTKPVLCTCIDLLFDPSLKIDPLFLWRQAARVTQVIVLWPGEYSDGILSYATPAHHHYWNRHISASDVVQPDVIIQRILT